jgi:NTE family protein
MDDTLQEQVINWGYAVCDAALRAHLDATLPLATLFPFPSAGVASQANVEP